MLKPPRQLGPQHLRAFIDYLGFDQACNLVDVHPGTMRRWLRGASPVPAAALQALYWLTPWGYSAAFAESHVTNQTMAWRLRVLESMRNNATTMGFDLAANESVWNELRPRRLQLVSGPREEG